MSRASTPLPSEEALIELAAKSGWRAGSLARKLGLSQRQFERRVRQVHGMSPHEWIDRQRCIIAVRELKRRRQSKWVAGNLGFSSTAHFSRWFKARMLVTATTFVQTLIDAAGDLDLPL